LVHADEGAVLDWGQEVSYYHGWEGGESWSEGGRSSSQVLKIREPGRYRIKIVGKAGRGEHFEENFTGFQGQVQLLKEVTLMRYYAFGLGLALFPFVMWLITHEMESDD
jgi:hypothetical protein